MSVVETSSKTFDSNEEKFASLYPFPLSDFQKWAISAYLADQHVLVTAHTGSGKTLPAEFAIQDTAAHYPTKRIIYTSPIKSLSNQKFYEFKHKFPQTSVGILTGDIKFNPQAQVLIMTTEILRNVLFTKRIRDASSNLDIQLDVYNEVHTVIFDEVHYINDEDRGRVWEECLILLPKHVRLIMLSATIAHPEKFAHWVATIKSKNVVLCGNAQRVVPLTHNVFVHFLSSFMKAHSEFDDIFDKYNDKLTVVGSSASGYDGMVFQTLFHRLQKCNMGLSRNGCNELVWYLHSYSLNPSLFFCFSRAKCETLAMSIELKMITDEEAATVKRTIDYCLRLTNQYDTYSEMDQFRRLQTCLLKGVAFHHSGLIPVLKEIVELLYSKHLVKVLFATETFAVGVNMPTKTVVFTSLEKHDGKDFRWLKSHEYNQMAGRAGRRGMDKQGWVILMPENGLPDPTRLKEMMCGPPQSLQSKFKPHINLLLKVILTGLDLENIVQASLFQAELDEQADGLEKQIADKEFTIPSSDYSACVKYERLMSETTIQGFKKNPAMVKKHRQEADQLKTAEFFTLWNEYINSKDDLDELERLKAELRQTNRYFEFQLQHMLRLMEEMEYLTRSDFPIQAKHVTMKGRIANEIHECNPVYLTTMVLEGIDDSVDESLLAGYLAMFGQSDGGKQQDTVLNVDHPIQDRIYQMVELLEELGVWLENKELEKGIQLSYDWNLNVTLPLAVYDWIKGDPFQNVINRYHLYEGSFIKDLMKIYHIAAELESVAQIAERPRLALTSQRTKQLLMRDVVNAESLYIRLQ